MLTIKAEVLKKDERVGQIYNVKIRFTYKRQVRRVSTSLFATLGDIYPTSFRLKEGTAVKQEADKLVIGFQEMVKELQVDVNRYTLDEIISYVKREKKKEEKIDFIVFSRRWIKECELKGAVNYNTALNSFISFIGTDHLEIQKITVKLLTGFMKFLQGKRNPGSSNRIITLYLGCIRHLYKEAMMEYNDYDTDVILIPRSPFDYFNIPKQEITRKRAITAECIKTIMLLPDRGTRFDLARDCFILSFCLMGMNSVDLYRCNVIQNNVITYYRSKTTDRRQDKALMKVVIPEKVFPLLDRYKDITGIRVFDFYKRYSTYQNFNKALNKGLKEVGKILNIPDLEFYAARHSWATIAVNQVGIDKYTVHSALNHLDETMKVTDIYIERDFSKENEANQKVIDFIQEIPPSSQTEESINSLNY